MGNKDDTNVLVDSAEVLLGALDPELLNDEPLDIEDVVEATTEVDVIKEGFLLDEENETKLNGIYQVVEFFRAAKENEELTELQFDVIKELVAKDGYSNNEASFLITGDGSIGSNNAFADFITGYIVHCSDVLNIAVSKANSVIQEVIKIGNGLPLDKLEEYKTLEYRFGSENFTYMAQDNSIFDPYELTVEELRDQVTIDGYGTPQFEELCHVIINDLQEGNKSIKDIVKLTIIAMDSFNEINTGSLNEMSALTTKVLENPEELTYSDLPNFMYGREKMIGMTEDAIRLYYSLIKHNIFDLIEVGCLKVL